MNKTIVFFSITPVNYSNLYFDLVQNKDFKNYINPGIEKCPYFQSANFRLSNYDFFGFYNIETKEIIACAFIGGYKGYEHPYSLCYIWVNQEYRNNGLATSMLNYMYDNFGPKVSMTGLSPYGFLYLKDKLVNMGYKVDDHVSFWPNEWGMKEINEFKEKYIKNSC